MNIRCLFSRPELLGEPAPVTVLLSPTAETTTTPAPKNVPENGTEEVDAASPNEALVAGVGSRDDSASVVPVSMVVRAVRTLSSPPFLRRGGGVPDAGKLRGGGGGGIPPRLQLAAVSVLRVLVSGHGAKYVVKATAAASAGWEAGPDEGGEGEGEAERPEKDAGDIDEGESLAVGLLVVDSRSVRVSFREEAYTCRKEAVTSRWSARI